MCAMKSTISLGSWRRSSRAEVEGQRTKAKSAVRAMARPVSASTASRSWGSRKAYSGARTSSKMEAPSSDMMEPRMSSSSSKDASLSASVTDDDMSPCVETTATGSERGCLPSTPRVFSSVAGATATPRARGRNKALLAAVNARGGVSPRASPQYSAAANSVAPEFVQADCQPTANGTPATRTACASDAEWQQFAKTSSTYQPLFSRALDRA
mmetsp:Transcript_1373/g.3999  ORF Transcript_1373/g.3999 Transcript_1373/m.3999 type:complete len:212 (+) Transcript_1373:943-1578(+)